MLVAGLTAVGMLVAVELWVAGSQAVVGMVVTKGSPDMVDLLVTADLAVIVDLPVTAAADLMVAAAGKLVKIC
jgi:hypothetical protein